MIPLLFRNYLINRGNQRDSAQINFIGNVLLPLFALIQENVCVYQGREGNWKLILVL